jgi:hypothetical protein
MRYANCCRGNPSVQRSSELDDPGAWNLVDEPSTGKLVSGFLSFRRSPMADTQSITITSPQNVLNLDKSALAFLRSSSSMVVCMILACTFRVPFGLGETVENVRG